MQLPAQELEGPLAVDRVRADKPVAGAAIANSQFRRVQMAHLSKLMIEIRFLIRFIKADAG